jgi:hypothetical protein
MLNALLASSLSQQFLIGLKMLRHSATPKLSIISLSKYLVCKHKRKEYRKKGMGLESCGGNY